ncbi:AraC family transcriptional regulator [Luteolibacter arcticus]|uniref:AraC family transcriptional regulator n=1 Tax=Luteolibacter arcticus TaxID=1581411 RepID=A0ABT3GKJ4_9BACT|nr:AraC family transcriptional regulator [Luteolibacter arcticus]MCW1923991.1 AraC family transcriptional regulator [Luteolibacter arcticus]
MRGIRETIHPPGGHSFRLLEWSQSLREVDSVISPGRTVRVPGAGNHWHFHPEMELTLFHTGQGTRFVGDHIGPFAAGDLVLLGERLPHYWHPKGASSGISVQWHFPDDHPFWGFPENLVLAELFKRSGHGISITGKTAEAVSSLMGELTKSMGTGQLGIFLIILARLGRASGRDLRLLSASAFNLPSESAHQAAMAKAVRHLIASFRDEVHLEDVLKITGMSRATFARQFKRHSGHSFSGFLNRLRLQAACRELEKSDRGILDISLACGFPHVSFFNRLFRREMRCNPTDYRKRSRARKA